MNNDQVIEMYEDLSTLTGRMLAAARSGDWDNLVELETDCAARVQALQAGEPVAALSGASRERKVQMIHEILANDRAIRDLTMPWMARLSTMINSAGTERKLAAAYGTGLPR